MKKKHKFSPSDFVPKKKENAQNSQSQKELTNKKSRTKSNKTQHSKATEILKSKNNKLKPLKKNANSQENTNSFFLEKEKTTRPKKSSKKMTEIQNDNKMPLNKYIAHCGICSRREAIEIIKKGKIKVNSLIETNPASRVSEKDYIYFENKRLFPQKNLLYFLLNKPKNCICTTSDPEERNTVMDLFKGYEEYRLFPIGRLDRNTTGLIIITNDGELAQRLSHPKFNIKKVYQVTLDKNLHKRDFDKIMKGLVLEDGLAEVDEVAYINLKDKKEIGLQIHSGKNRIVRRIFEHLGYQVKALDRVVYAGLTKKNLPRGAFRPIEKKELIFLKHFK